MPAVYGAIDLQKNELRQAVIQNLASAPSSPVKGQLYFDSTGNILYWWSGTQWIAAQGAAGAVPADTVSTQAIGDSPSAGASTLYSRGDHKHGMPAFGAVTQETTFGTTKADGAAVTIARSDHTHGNPVHDAAAHSAIPLSALAAATGNINMANFQINNVGTPTANTDAVNKQYADNLAQGLDAKASVRAASTANIANLLSAAPNTLDGVSLAVGDRLLLKDQTTPATNGIYTVTTVGTGANGVWARAADMDTWAEVPSAYTWVEQGTANADTGWLSTADQGGTLNTTAIPWVQFSGAGQITAGAGLTKTANTIDFVAGDSSLTVASDSVIVNTSVIATVASVTAGLATKAGKYSAALTGTASPEVVTHNLNTRDIADVMVINGSSPWQAVVVDWEATSVNTVTVRYNPNLGAGYRVVVTG